LLYCVAYINAEVRTLRTLCCHLISWSLLSHKCLARVVFLSSMPTWLYALLNGSLMKTLQAPFSVSFK
jgi:hypothetical protein